MLIADAAGTGKTTVLTHLSKMIKQAKPNLWVVRIDLNDHADELRKQKGKTFITDTAAKFISQQLLKLKNPLEKDLFSQSFKSGEVSRLVLMFDGFDEISPSCKDTVINLLTTLKDTQVKQLWVTTRSHLEETLENDLQQIAYTLEPFSETNQIDFLVRFWKKNLGENSNENRLNIYATELVKKLSVSINDKEKEFTGVPLQIKMLAEVFERRQEESEIPEEIKNEVEIIEEGVKEFCDSSNKKPNIPDKFNLLSLYKNFIYKKYYEVYGEEKTKTKTAVAREQLNESYPIFINKHHELAIHKLLPEKVYKEFFPENKIESLIKDIEHGKEKRGIIDRITEGKANFVHQTFVEYFAADFLAKQIKIKETSEVMKDFIIKEIFKKSDYRGVRIFINDIFGKDGSPSEDIMKLYGDRVDHLWMTDKEKIILLGEEVLDGTILAQGVREGNVEIVKLLLDGLKKGEHKETLKELLLHTDKYGSILHRAGWETGTPDALDEIFKWIKYLKEENGSVMVTEDEIVELLEAEDYRGRTLLHRISRWGRGKTLDKIYDFFKNFISKEVLLKKDKEGPKGQSVWQRVGKGGDVGILYLLLKLSKEKNIEVGEIKDELLTKDKSLTTFNQAVKWGNIDILEKLVNLKDGYIEITPQDLKIALESTDNKGVKKTEKKPGRTVFHRAVYNNPDKQLDKQKQNHETLAQESQYSRTEVLNKLMEFCIKAGLSDKEIKELLEKGNQKGNTALHLAVKKGLFDESQWLAEKMGEYGANLDAKNLKNETALMWAAEKEKWDIAVMLLNHGADIKGLNTEQCGLLRRHIEQGNNENKAQLLEKIEQRLSELSVASVMEVVEQAGQVLEPMEVDEAGPPRCRRDLQGCSGEEREEQGRVFPYEPLEESVSVEQQRSARLQSQLALAVVWGQREPADKLLQYQRYLGDILNEGSVNQSPREQSLLHNHYQQAQQFFADNPKTTLLEIRADNFEPLAGHSVLLENGQQSLLVFNAGERYQLYSPDFNYRQRFQTHVGVSWSELSGFIRAFFAWKSGSGEYRPLVLTDQLPGKTLAQLQAAPYWEPDTLAPDSVLLAREQAGLIEGIPARVVRELVRVNGQVVDSAALHADFFQTPGIQLRVEKLHSVLTELTKSQRRAVVQGVNKYHWSADSTLLETLSTEERPLLVDYQQRVMNELKTADTLTPERLSEFSWQAMAQAIEKQPELPAELKQPVLDNLKAMHRTASQRAWAKGMATQTLFFLPDMIRAANTGQVGGLVGTAGMLAADGGVNHLYGRLLERLAPTLGEARLGLLQKLPVTSPVFKALTVYSIVELTKQLHSLPPNSEQRQTIKHRLGEQYVTIGIMAAELLGLETGPLWIGLMAEQLIFEAMTFRKENQLDIPFWEAFIMSLGFEQDKLQHIVEERQLVELNLATVDNINTQATPPYGWVLVKVPSLGPLTWQPLDESQVPPHIREEIINQPLPFSIFPSTTITREAASFRQIEHYELNWVFMTEGDEGSLMTGNFASPTLGKLLNTTWHLGTYTAQETAIHMQWGPSGRSCQEDNVFLATPKAPLANYRRIASVTGKNYPFCLPRTPVKISGPGLAALYVNNHTTATEGAPRNLYLGFDPREGDITLLIQPSGLRELDNINRDYHPDAAPDDNGSYSLTVQVSNKGYPPAIMFQPQLGILMVEEKSRRLHSHYFISSDTAPFYLYDDALTTRIAISPPSHRPIGFIVRSYGPKGLIQLQTWAPNSTQPIPAFPPSWYTDRHAVNFKKALQPLLPHQVSTLYLPNKKYLQLMLDRQQIAGVLMLEAEQVEVLAAKGQDAYQSGIYMTTAVTRFTVTLVGHLQVTQGNTRLFFIGETPDNTPVIRYSTQPSAPHSPMYQLELPVLQPVLDSLCRLDSREIHFSTPGLRYAWVPDVEQPAVLKIMAPLNGQRAQLLLEQNGTTLSQLDEQQQWRIMAVDHYSQQATLDNQLVLQQVVTGGNTTNLGVYQSAGDPAQDLQVVDSVYPQGPGDILWFQSPQGYPVLHRFASGQKMTLNGIDYQIADNRLYAIGAQTGIIDGDQLIRYRTPTRRVGIRVTSSLAESQLSWDKGELTINQLTLRNLPEQTPIDLGGQVFPLKALKESVQRPRHHHRRDLPRAEPLTSGATRHQPWASTLFKEAATLLSGISWKWTTWGSTPTLTGQPAQPPQNSKITVDEYTSGHFQGLLQLLDLGVRQWTGQKYGQQPVIANGSWAEASVQASQVIEEFHQTLQCAARACGVKLSTMTQRFDEMTLRNQVAQKLYTGQPQAIENLLQPVVQGLYQTLCSRATQKQADRFMAHWNRHNNQSVDIGPLQQQWVSLPSTNNMTCLTNRVDPLSIPQLPTRPLSRNHLT